MDLKYKYEVMKNKVVVKDIDIDLENTLFSGQAFRWNKTDEGFKGVCYNRVVLVYKQGSDLVFDNTDKDFFLLKLSHYFDLYKDYNKIINGFGFDEVLDKSLKYAPGIRVLNQEPFEALISFIISANNNIKRIRSIIDNLCKKYGDKIDSFGSELYSFPKPEMLAEATLEDLYLCGAGYRAPYIKETASMIADGFILNGLKQLSYLEARKKLTELKGVGNKVADCVLLYSLGFSNAFPLDVWIKRVIHNLYGFESEKDSEILGFIEKTFGKYAGIAQQYLFYYVKENKLGIK
jgi:N-glycosylase/DNA lyase